MGSFAQARSAQQAYCDALTEFEVACGLGNDEQVEAARAKVLGCCESFMDHFAAGHRRMKDQE